MTYLFILAAGLGASLALPGPPVAEVVLTVCVGIEYTNVIKKRRVRWMR